MMNRLVLMVVVLGFAPPSVADVYLETKLMVSEHTGKIWTSGLKRRTDAPTPMLGPMAEIARVDQGIEWTLDLSRNLYEEKPIAIPYQPAEGTIPASGQASDETEWTFRDGREAEDVCTPQVEPLSGSKTVAGYATTGYRVGCVESPQEGAILWMAPLSGVLAQVEQESRTFERAYQQALYANYPPDEQREMTEGLLMLGTLLQTAFAEAFKDVNPAPWGGVKELPKGFPLAVELVERAEDGQFKRVTMFEVTTLSTAPIDPSVFAVPDGFRKVDDLAQVQMQGVVDEFDPEQAAEALERMMRRFEETFPEETQETSSR